MSSENSAIPVCPEQQILRTSQGNLSFRACGEGETLIFLHGILGSSKAWPFQFAAFSPATASWPGMHRVMPTPRWFRPRSTLLC